MSRRVMFFATREDLLAVLQRVERRVPLTYRRFVTQVGEASDTLVVPTWDAAASIEALGSAVEGDMYRQPSYMLMPAASRFILRERVFGNRTHRGVYPEGNPDSVMFYPGGLYADECLVAGEFAVGIPRPAGFDLFGVLRRAVQAEFERVLDCYVGPHARRRAEAGARLVGGTWQPPELDLKLPTSRNDLV